MYIYRGIVVEVYRGEYVVEYLEEYLLIESVDSLTTTGRRVRGLHLRLECSQLCTLREPDPCKEEVYPSSSTLR